MKTKAFFLLFCIALIITSCSKDKLASKKLEGNWSVKNFYVNDIDATDSLLNITRNGTMGIWFYSFTLQDWHLGGPWGQGIWSLSDKGTKLMTTVSYSDSIKQGPFLAPDKEISWELNYSKLCNENEMWIITHFNNSKYETHFYKFQ